MPKNLTLYKKISIILVLLIPSGLWFHFAYAQDANTNSGQENSKFSERIHEFDSLLNISVSAPLTALSLTGATFLTRSGKENNEDSSYAYLMDKTKKNLIKAFVLFLACTIAIFIFDFIELLLPHPFIMIETLDLAITYSLLFIGFAYLAIAAYKMYLTQAKWVSK